MEIFKVDEESPSLKRSCCKSTGLLADVNCMQIV